MPKMRVNQAINAALAEEMRADPAVMIMGEDVAAAGGPFKTSEGLLDEFGPLRVRDTPISEMGFTGAAVGAAAMGTQAGRRDHVRRVPRRRPRPARDRGREVPLPEQGPGHRARWWCAPRSEAASASAASTARPWRTGSSATPGLKVVVPSDAQSAYGLTRAALRDPDPTVVLEPRALYGTRGEVVTGEEGIVRHRQGPCRALKGSQATVVTLGQTTGIALAAAEAGDLDVEIIDLLTLVPWDRRRRCSSPCGAPVDSSSSRRPRSRVAGGARSSPRWSEARSGR